MYIQFLYCFAKSAKYCLTWFSTCLYFNKQIAHLPRVSLLKRPTIALCLILLFMLCPVRVSAAEPLLKVAGADPLLQSGIDQYVQENYEEAVEIFSEYRRLHPGSSPAAYFLGISYKASGNLREAISNLRAAARLTPHIKEAIVELADSHYQAGEYKEALRWVDIAEREEIYPARVSFIRGLILAKTGKDKEAIAAFEKARRLDPALAQEADFQIALTYVKGRDYKKANERLQAVIKQDANSDLAGFARTYQDLVENRMFIERPVRFTVGFFGGYDTNVILKPLDDNVAPNITDEKTYFLNSNLRVDYVPVFDGPWLFNATYALGSSLHQKHSTSHDYLTNTISMAPGYNFGKYAFNIAAFYGNALLRDPSYKSYLDLGGVGPMGRVLLGGNQILEAFAGIYKQNYHRQPLAPEDDRDSDGKNAYLSWTWMFRENWLLNLKYELSRDKTDGIWWDNIGNRFTANLIAPIVAKLKGQAVADIHVQDYKYENSAFNNTKRRDRTSNWMLGLTYDLNRHTSLIAQYAYTRGYSNISIYDYDRNLYQVGVELRF